MTSSLSSLRPLRDSNGNKKRDLDGREKGILCMNLIRICSGGKSGLALIGKRNRPGAEWPRSDVQGSFIRGVATVVQYRCFFVDSSGGFVATDDFHSVNDTTAVENAETLAGKRGYRGFGFEVWQGDRLVHRQEPIDLPPAA